MSMLVFCFLKTPIFKVVLSFFSFRLLIFKFNPYPIQGKYLATNPSAKTKSECINLPKHWMNKTSSVLTNGCIILFDDLDCKTNKTLEIFHNVRSRLKEIYVSWPSKIPNNNFHGTWFNDKAVSFRKCDFFEELLSILRLRKQL